MLLLLAALSQPAEAWGPTGHRAVAELAWRHTHPRTRRAIAALLDGESLAEASTWPDWIRSDPTRPDQGPWHYVSVDDAEALEAAATSEGPHVLWALAQVEARLADRALPRYERVEALRWVVHLVGDLHQPLHVGRADDRGGNQVKVTWMREPTNLHKLWDEDLIDFERLSYTELATFLDDASPAQRAAWRAAPPLDWARESLALRGLVYELGDRELSWDYRFRALEVVHERLRQAGHRLAARLDRALGPGR